MHTTGFDKVYCCIYYFTFTNRLCSSTIIQALCFSQLFMNENIILLWKVLIHLALRTLFYSQYLFSIILKRHANAHWRQLGSSHSRGAHIPFVQDGGVDASEATLMFVVLFLSVKLNTQADVFPCKR